MNMETMVFSLITHSGDARSSALEAIAEAKKGNFEAAQAKLTQADEAASAAHKSQTELIQAEAGGEGVEISLLLIHAQDHLMNAMTVRQLAEEIIDLHQRLAQDGATCTAV